MASDFKRGIESQNASDIPMLYDSVMKGYSSIDFGFSSELMEEGYYHKLYAPGYDNNGIAEVSAKCL